MVYHRGLSAVEEEIDMRASEPGQVGELFVKYFNAGDRAGIESLYEADATLVPGPGMAPISGIDGIRPVLEKLLSSGGTMTVLKSAVFTGRDVALTHTTWRLEMKDESGKPTIMEGTGAEVLRRQPDGTWRFAVDNPWG
jgi:ketosteroid isomerase-like protein